MEYKYDIVLATYNGSKYLRHQLDSIIDAVDFCKIASINNLIITDDGSKDDTVKIIKEHYSFLPYLKFINNELAKGVISNFQNGINNSKADYVFLSDQDDIWEVNKITATMQILLQNKKNTQPFLVITNVNLVDENGIYLSKGHDFEQFDPIDPIKTAYRSFGQGCTMGMNRALINKVGIFPKEAVMHDWWLLLVASNFGEVRYIDYPLLNYRQHDDNVFGGNRHRSLLRYINLRNQRAYIHSLSIQSKKFLKIYGKELNRQDVIDIHIFLADIANKNMFEKFQFFRRYRLELKGIKNRAKFFIQLFA